MRFLVLDSYYTGFLEAFYRGHPELLDLLFEDQRRVLMAQAFGTADFFSRALISLGHEAEEIVANDDHLQRKWAAEHGLAVRDGHRLLAKARARLLRANWRYDVIRAQVKTIRPDVILVQEINLLPDSLLKQLKVPGRLLVGQVAAELPPTRTFAAYDLVISSLPHYVARFREQGLKAEYLPLGFGAGGLEELPAAGDVVAVSHIGGYGPIHAERNTLLERVAEQLPVDFWGYGEEHLSPGSSILRRFRGQAWGLDMYRIRRRSRVAVTKHIASVAGPYVNNCSLFEITGTGSCLVVDRKQNLAELFTPDTEAVAYSTPEECAEKIAYLLDHDDERRAVAAAGQRRTLREHTYFQRVQQLLQILRRYER